MENLENNFQTFSGHRGLDRIVGLHESDFAADYDNYYSLNITVLNIKIRRFLKTRFQSFNEINTK